MPTNNQNLPEDHLIIEISSGVNSAFIQLLMMRLVKPILRLK